MTNTEKALAKAMARTMVESKKAAVKSGTECRRGCEWTRDQQHCSAAGAADTESIHIFASIRRHSRSAEEHRWLCAAGAGLCCEGKERVGLRLESCSAHHQC